MKLRPEIAGGLAGTMTKLACDLVVAITELGHVALCTATDQASAQLLVEVQGCTTRSAASSSTRRVRTAAASPRRSRTTSGAASGSARGVSLAKVSRDQTTASAAVATPTSAAGSTDVPKATSSAAPVVARDADVASEPPPQSRAEPIASPRSKRLPARAAAPWTPEQIADDRREELLAESEIFRPY